MMEILDRGVEAYYEFKKTFDPRIKDWPFTSNPSGPILLLTLYGIVVKLGPVYMRNRKPFDIKPLLVLYNFSMVLLSAYIVKELLFAGWLFEYSLGCQPVDYSTSPQAMRMAAVVWWFFMAKFIELLDTVFFVLRKKDNQITFLHVFHHGCLPLFWWWGVNTVPGGFGTFHGLVNCIVHVVMYFYYGVAALGPKFQKYLWWKRYVTILQLSQFFIVTLHNSQYLFMECKYPWIFVAFIQGFTTLVAVLFLNFYVKTYLSKGRQPRSSLSSNGRVVSNGANLQNGSTTTVRNGKSHKMD